MEQAIKDNLPKIERAFKALEEMGDDRATAGAMYVLMVALLTDEEFAEYNSDDLADERSDELYELASNRLDSIAEFGK